MRLRRFADLLVLKWEKRPAKGRALCSCFSCALILALLCHARIGRAAGPLSLQLGQDPPRCAAAGLSPSLRSKLPCASILALPA